MLIIADGRECSLDDLIFRVLLILNPGGGTGAGMSAGIGDWGASDVLDEIFQVFFSSSSVTTFGMDENIFSRMYVINESLSTMSEFDSFLAAFLSRS